MAFCICTICLENIYPIELIAHTDCLHLFHRQCLTTWLETKNTCPLCRSFLGEIPDHGNNVPILASPAPFVPLVQLEYMSFTIGIIITRRSEASRHRSRHNIRRSTQNESDEN